MKCDVSFSQGSISTLCRWGERFSCMCKNVLRSYSSAKIIKIKQAFPELWSQMYCHIFYEPHCRMWAIVQRHSCPRGELLTAALSSSDRLTWKPTTRIKHQVTSYHTAEVLLIWIFTCPTLCRKGTINLSRGWLDPDHVCCGDCSLATDCPYHFRFPNFPCIMECWAQVWTLGPQIGENCGFCPSDC